VLWNLTFLSIIDTQIYMYVLFLGRNLSKFWEWKFIQNVFGRNGKALVPLTPAIRKQINFRNWKSQANLTPAESLLLYLQFSISNIFLFSQSHKSHRSFVFLHQPSFHIISQFYEHKHKLQESHGLHISIIWHKIVYKGFIVRYALTSVTQKAIRALNFLALDLRSWKS
jgi:hypothetical protein